MFKMISAFLLLFFTSSYPNNHNNQSKIPAYNTKSEKFISSVSEKAVNNSKALVSYPSITQPFTYQNSKVPTKNITPTPEIIFPTVAPISPIPTPIKCSERLCPMISCTDSFNKKAISDSFIEDCCLCYPPPIY